MMNWAYQIRLVGYGHSFAHRFKMEGEEEGEWKKERGEEALLFSNFNLIFFFFFF